LLGLNRIKFLFRALESTLRSVRVCSVSQLLNLLSDKGLLGKDIVPQVREQGPYSGGITCTAWSRVGALGKYRLTRGTPAMSLEGPDITRAGDQIIQLLQISLSDTKVSDLSILDLRPGRYNILNAFGCQLGGTTTLGIKVVLTGPV
jgi:hypothetical protein